jgi:hypothetical protein
MEAEYIALYYVVVQEIIWFRALLIGLELIDSGTPTTILIDNTSARSLAYNSVHHSRSKHIDVKFHWLREQVAAGHTTLEYVESAKQLADLLTHILTGTTSTDTPFGSCTIPTVPCFDTSYQTIAKRSTCVTQAGLAC